MKSLQAFMLQWKGKVEHLNYTDEQIEHECELINSALKLELFEILFIMLISNFSNIFLNNATLRLPLNQRKLL